MALVKDVTQKTTGFKPVGMANISLAHAQLMHWIIEHNENFGKWPDEAQLHASDEFSRDLLNDLQDWNLLAWDENERAVALDQWVNLPVVGSVAAGVPIEAIENHQGQLSMPLSLFKERPTYLLKVRGDSMKDVGILDGDLIAVRKTEDVSEGKIIVARVENEVTVKRLKFEGDQVALLPENKAYTPIMVAPDDLTIEGLFVGVIRGGKAIH